MFKKWGSCDLMGDYGCVWHLWVCGIWEQIGGQTSANARLASPSPSLKMECPPPPPGEKGGGGRGGGGGSGQDVRLASPSPSLKWSALPLFESNSNHAPLASAREGGWGWRVRGGWG